MMLQSSYDIECHITKKEKSNARRRYFSHTLVTDSTIPLFLYKKSIKNKKKNNKTYNMHKNDVPKNINTAQLTIQYSRHYTKTSYRRDFKRKVT